LTVLANLAVLVINAALMVESAAVALEAECADGPNAGFAAIQCCFVLLPTVLAISRMDVHTIPQDWIRSGNLECRCEPAVIH
jgi:hypothetical protein